MFHWKKRCDTMFTVRINTCTRKREYAVSTENNALHPEGSRKFEDKLSALCAGKGADREHM